MPEETVVDANNIVVDKDSDFNTKADAILDAYEGKSSNPEAGQDNEVEENQEAGADQPKNANPDTEAELSEEEATLKKINEALGDDPKAIEAYIKKMGYHKDPAWQKLLAKSKQSQAIDSDTQKQLEEFKLITSSPDYVTMSMKRQGYTQEAIDQKLKELGHDIPDKQQDDFALVASKLGIDPASMDANTKATVTDIAKIARVVAEEMLGKTLPKTLQPIEETVQGVRQANEASKLTSSMRETVKNEGVLDFEKDIEPELHKFLDNNPEATQKDIADHFSVLNHRLTVERLKTGKAQVARADKKSVSRPLSVTAGNKPVQIKKTGNFNKDADAFLDAVGYPS